jgi:hypothetical protein
MGPTPSVIPPSPPESTSSIGSSNFVSTVILNNIFDLLLKMISSLQNVAAAQANRLTFQSQWQSAYTNLMAQVPVFVAGNSGPFSGSDTANVNARNDLNNLNSTFTQTLQNRQSIVSDNSKALQSNINQSNDAVNQQSNLGTAIIQELGTLLSAIFR